MAMGFGYLQTLKHKKIKTTHLVIGVLVLIIAALIFFGWYYFIAGRSPEIITFADPKSQYEYLFTIYEPQHLKRPLSVTTDATGNIFITDSVNHAIVVFDPKGRFKYKFGGIGQEKGRFNYPVSVVIDGRKVYVADFYNQRVQVLTKDGKPLAVLPAGKDRDKLGSPLMPVALAVDKDGNLYVSDVNQQRIVVFDAGGSYVRYFGAAGSKQGEISYVNGIAIDDDEDGKIYLADSNNARIDVFNIDGKFIKVLDKAGTVSNPKGITFDREAHRIYVSDTLVHLIKGIDTDGNVSEIIGGRGADKGYFNFPTGIWADGRNRLYIADRENNRVQVFERN